MWVLKLLGKCNLENYSEIFYVLTQEKKTNCMSVLYELYCYQTSWFGNVEVWGNAHHQATTLCCCHPCHSWPHQLVAVNLTWFTSFSPAANWVGRGHGLCTGTYLSMLLICERGPGTALVCAEQHLSCCLGTARRVAQTWGTLGKASLDFVRRKLSHLVESYHHRERKAALAHFIY